MKRRARQADEADWRLHIEPRFGNLPLVSITSAEVASWKRSVGWSTAIKAIGMSGLRVHDLRHTAASVWLGSRADPKVVQRILGRASAAMTMDLYGHLIDQNLWDAAKKVGGTTEAPKAIEAGSDEPPASGNGA